MRFNISGKKGKYFEKKNQKEYKMVVNVVPVPEIEKYEKSLINCNTFDPCEDSPY